MTRWPRLTGRLATAVHAPTYPTGCREVLLFYFSCYENNMYNISSNIDSRKQFQYLLKRDTIYIVPGTPPPTCCLFLMCMPPTWSAARSSRQRKLANTPPTKRRFFDYTFIIPRSCLPRVPPPPPPPPPHAQCKLVALCEPWCLSILSLVLRAYFCCRCSPPSPPHLFPSLLAYRPLGWACRLMDDTTVVRWWW